MTRKTNVPRAAVATEVGRVYILERRSFREIIFKYYTADRLNYSRPRF